jgi:hypothetical protein
MSEESNGSAYLAALKRGAGGAASAASTAPQVNERAMQGPASAGVAAMAKPSGIEKRRSPRYKCEGSVEIREVGGDVRIWATCTDISMHGCYVEATTAYPVGTVLQMKIEAQNLRIQAQGNVRVAYPNLGMGVAFTQMAEEDRARLKEVLRTIGRPSVIMGMPSAHGSPDPIPDISNHRAAVAALIEFFDTRQMLTRGEFVRLLHRSQARTNGTHQ